jgi:hypothetical protein
VADRTKVPAHTRDAVLCEAGYMCGNPRCRHILTLELHHIVWVRDGGGNEPANLLCLCPNCHALHTAGHIPQSAILHWKGALEALNHAFNRESRDLLLFLHATDRKSIWYTGDGLLRFASLISAGLVEIAKIRHGEGAREKREGFLGPHTVEQTPPLTTGMVRLSERGRHLVKAWLAGEAISLIA